MNIIFIGPQGCGKGTQAQLLKRKHHYCYISTGSLLRKLAKSHHNNELSTTSGKLVSDDVINELVDNKITKHHSGGFIFDGYPRTLNQAKHLMSTLKQGYADKPPVVFYLELEDAEAIRRISKRLTCTKCGYVAYPNKYSLYQLLKICPNCHGSLAIRADDNAEAVKERLKLFHDETYPLIEFFTDLGILFKINGKQSINQIHYQIEKIINDKL